MTSNEINFWRQQEDARHNLEFEKETHRHNVRTEEISETQAAAAMLNAQINAMYAGAHAQAAIWGAQASLMQADATILNAQINQKNADLNYRKWVDESALKWADYNLEVTKFDWTKQNTETVNLINVFKGAISLGAAAIAGTARVEAAKLRLRSN